MQATRGQWFTPNLAAYRAYLLAERGLAPASTVMWDFFNTHAKAAQ